MSRLNSVLANIAQLVVINGVFISQKKVSTQRIVIAECSDFKMTDVRESVLFAETSRRDSTVILPWLLLFLREKAWSPGIQRSRERRKLAEDEMSATMFHVFSLFANAWDTGIKVNCVVSHVRFLTLFREMLIMIFFFPPVFFAVVAKRLLNKR